MVKCLVLNVWNTWQQFKKKALTKHLLKSSSKDQSRMTDQLYFCCVGCKIDTNGDNVDDNSILPGCWVCLTVESASHMSLYYNRITGVAGLPLDGGSRIPLHYETISLIPDINKWLQPYNIIIRNISIRVVI